jgi:ATP-dependent Clp protease adaptor protein ClpS
LTSLAKRSYGVGSGPPRDIGPRHSWQDVRTMTTTKAKNREETRTGEKASEAIEPPWNVVLHNDWHTTINRVVWRLWRTIPDMTMKRATRVMWEAHTKSRTVAKSCHKELAELYEERLRANGLTVFIEPTR